MRTHKYVIFLLFFLFFIFAFFLWEFKSINVNNRQNVDAVETTTRFSKNLNQLRFELLKTDNNLSFGMNKPTHRLHYDFKTDSTSLIRLFNEPTFAKITETSLNTSLTSLRNKVEEKLTLQSVYVASAPADSMMGVVYHKKK